MSDVRQAVILVGGRGTRLGVLAQDMPKPLLPMDGDVRFLDYVLHAFAAAGAQSFLLLAGHLAESVVTRYEGARLGNAPVTVVREPSPAGTAGALHFARDKLEPTFFMANGDSLFDFSIAALPKALKANDLGALALRRIDDSARYGRVTLDGDRIRAFHEKDETWRAPALISGGVYALRREIMGEIGPPPSSLETDVFPKLAAAGRLAGAVYDGFFIDIGLPHTLEQGRAELPQRFSPPPLVRPS